MKDLIIGVDGGGTRSRILLIDSATKEVLGRQESGPANINSSVDESWNSIIEGIEDILGHKISDIAVNQYNMTLVAGLAGTEISSACDDFKNHQYSNYFNSLDLLSDGHIACIGALDGENGSLISIGTGTIGYQIQTGKEPNRVSGWGFPHSDEGGGAWLGIEAIRILFKALDKRIESSALLDFLFNKYENNLDQLIFLSNQKSQNWFGKAGSHVIEFYQENGRGDRHLNDLMNKAANEIILIINALDTSSGSSLPICLAGGLSKFLIDWLPEHIQQRIVKSKSTPEEGAVSYALNKYKKR